MYTEAISEEHISIEPKDKPTKSMTSKTDHVASINELQLKIDHTNKDDI